MMWPEGTLIYEYLIELDEGDVLVVDTGTYREGGISAGKYTRDREIIDRMMQTLRFDP
jgi:hypothetical protein